MKTGSPLPTLGVFLAHLFLLQDLLGVESMSAGAWYVAIDLQLFGLFALLAHIAHRSKRPLSDSYAPLIVAATTVTSIHIFSREAALDAYALYYFSAYGLGALVAWAPNSGRARMWLWITVALLLLDWLSDPRTRPVLALLTAFCLYGFSHIRWQNAMNPLRRSIEYLSDVSYSMFVSHFAVIIVVSGIWEKLDLDGFVLASLVVFIAWLASLAVGASVQYFCEQSMRLIKPSH